VEIVCPRPRSCDRAREWVSLQLDRELSDFERVLLDAHVRRCSTCGRFRAGVTAFTAALRAAPLERPPRPVLLPRRRAGSRAFRLAAATVAAVALILGTAAGVLTSERPRSHGPFVLLRPSYLDYPENQFRLTHQGDADARAPGYAARAL